jgi:hypothetical protein
MKQLFKKLGFPTFALAYIATIVAFGISNQSDAAPGGGNCREATLYYYSMQRSYSQCAATHGSVDGPEDTDNPCYLLWEEMEAARLSVISACTPTVY